MFNQLKENSRTIDLGLQKLDQDIGFLLHNYVQNGEKRAESIITERKQSANQIEKDCHQYLLQHKAFKNHLNTWTNDVAEIRGKIKTIMDEHRIPCRTVDNDADKHSPPHGDTNGNAKDESGINPLDDDDSDSSHGQVFQVKSSQKKSLLMETPMFVKSNPRIKTRLF